MADDVTLKVKFDTKGVASAGGGGGGSKKGGGIMGMFKKGGGGGGMGALGGIAKMATGIGVALVALDAIKAGMKALVNASPRLQQTLQIFQKSLMIFLRPIGDVIGNLLRPLALILMRTSIEFYKWMKVGPGSQIIDSIKEALGGGVDGQPGSVSADNAGQNAGNMVTEATGLQGLGDRFGIMVEFWTNLMRMVGAQFKFIGAWAIILGKAFAWLLDKVFIPFNPIIEAIGDAFGVITDYAVVMSDAFMDLAMGGSWDDFVAIWKDSLYALGEDFAGLIAGWWEGIEANFAKAWETQKQQWADFWALFQSGLEAVGNFFTTWVVDPILNSFRWLGEQITGFIQGILDKLPFGLGKDKDKGKANGGTVMAGQSYTVGEKGPETFTAGSTGSITPNGAGGGGGSVTININAMDASSIDAGVIAKIKNAIEQSTKRSISGRTTEMVGV